MSEQELNACRSSPKIGGLSYVLAFVVVAIAFVAIVLPVWVTRNLHIEFAPIAGDDVAVTAKGKPVNIVVLMNDADPIDLVNPKTVTVERTPHHGFVLIGPETGVVTYFPNAEFVGTDTFLYAVSNQNGVRSNLGAVKITVTP